MSDLRQEGASLQSHWQMREIRQRRGSRVRFTCTRRCFSGDEDVSSRSDRWVVVISALSCALGCRRLCTQRALFRNGRSLDTVRQSDKEQQSDGLFTVLEI